MNPAAAAPKPTIIPTKAVTGGLFGRLKCHNSLSLSRIPAERNKVASACFALLRERATMSERRTERENRTPLQKEQNRTSGKRSGTERILRSSHGYSGKEAETRRWRNARKEKTRSLGGKCIGEAAAISFFGVLSFARVQSINRLVGSRAEGHACVASERRPQGAAAQAGNGQSGLSLSSSTQASYQSNQLG